MNEIIITPEFCMQFLVWSYYYHSIIPAREGVFSESGMFRPYDADNMDAICSKILIFYGEESIRRACRQFDKAKEVGEECPFSQEMLDTIFAKPIA